MSPTPARQILIVEDDEAIATGIDLNLKLAGHRTRVARNGEEALAQVAADEFDLVLLDLNLPLRNGLEVLEEMRAADNLVPVIVVSARDGEFDKVGALRLGADDYLVKPFALAELLARIDAVLRRAHLAPPAEPTPRPAAAPPDGTLTFDDIVIDTAQRTVSRGGEAIRLTHLEFELLLFFVRHPSQVFGRERLFGAVWGQSVGSVRSVDNFVGQLRRRFEPDPDRPRHFITVRGSGYRFDP